MEYVNLYQHLKKDITGPQILVITESKERAIQVSAMFYERKYKGIYVCRTGGIYGLKTGHIHTIIVDNANIDKASISIITNMCPREANIFF